MLILACILACAISFALTFPIRKVIAPKFKFLDIPKDERRMHTKPMPLIGGLGIYIAFTVASLAFGYFDALPYIMGGALALAAVAGIAAAVGITRRKRKPT